DRTIGEREHGVIPHHVERPAHRRNPGRRAHRPERGADRVAARERGPADHDVGPAQPDERGAECEGMLEGGRRGDVGGKPVRMPRAKQSGHLGEEGAGSGTLQELDGSKALSLPGARLRCMSAIWNSYSKSLTARKPRTITVAPAARANSASSPSNDRTSTLGSATACRINATRSSRVKRGCFATLTATATI